MELIEGSEPNIRRIIYDSKFKVTGLESIDADPLITVDDSLIYPRDLQVFIHPPQCVDGFPGPIRDEQNVSGWWLLDGGSILPVFALDLNDDDIVLDMCASPGGKSLLITQTGKFASLVCNDNKLSRLGQLRRALAMYIPAGSEAASRIILKRKDASSVESWDECGIYDKVLLDVPCTSDRLSSTQDDNNIFATDRTTERLDLPQKQTKMLINALRSVRVGGSVIYSTCTLAPTQNELVVENAAVLAQQHYGIKCVERSLKRMENLLKRTNLYRFSDQQQRGSLVLPYIVSNFGPMFICKLQRII
uniref:NOL1/NOP2/Sun domain family member 4 n=1 Tax=Meloidogyne hapla TaxID=6305 RepID=A0A1I8BF58_MELHA